MDHISVIISPVAKLFFSCYSFDCNEEDFEIYLCTTQSKHKKLQHQVKFITDLI